MESLTAAEKDLLSRENDPSFLYAYRAAKRRIDQFDSVIHALDDRRVELNMSKAELSRKSGIPAAAIRRLFSIQRKNPTLNTLIAIADALELCVYIGQSPTYFDQSHYHDSRTTPGL
jgi:DNA-binding phage protein